MNNDLKSQPKSQAFTVTSGEEYGDVQFTTNYEGSRIRQLSRVQGEAMTLFNKKNTDYGDAFATYGPVGVIVRMGDKINRLVSVSKNGVALVNNESLRDTLMDLHNYAAMAIMLIDESTQSTEGA
jgi:hypothetical protein